MSFHKPDWMPKFCCKDYEYNHNRGIFFYYTLQEDTQTCIDITDKNGVTVLEACRYCPSCGAKLTNVK